MVPVLASHNLLPMSEAKIEQNRALLQSHLLGAVHADGGACCCAAKH